MRISTTTLAAGFTATLGLGVAAWGLAGLWGGGALTVHGSFATSQGFDLPSLWPLVAVVAGIVLSIAGFLLTTLRGRGQAPRLAAQAAAHAPLIVHRSGDDVTFVWATARADTRRRGTPRAALTR